MIKKNIFFGLLFLFCLSFLGLYSSCQASGDWDLTFEQQTYESLKYLSDNMSISPNVGIKYPSFYNKDIFDSNLSYFIFSSLETALENSIYSQSDYPYVAVRYNDSNNTLTFHFMNHTTIERVTYQGYSVHRTMDNSTDKGIKCVLTLSSDYNSVSSVSEVTSTTATSDIGRCTNDWAVTTSSGYNVLTTCYLSPTIYTNPSSDINPNSYTTRSRLSLNFNETNQNIYFDKNLVDVINFDIHCITDIGKFYGTKDLKFYYYSGDDKVYITNLITLNADTSLWWGTRYDPIIQEENYQSIPDEKQFYVDVYVKHTQADTTNAYRSQPTYELTLSKMAFNTLSSNAPVEPTPTPTPIPSGDTGSGDSSGDNYPFDYNGRFDNIDNSLNSISGELGNINENITSLVSDITSVPGNDDFNSIDSGDIVGAIYQEFHPMDDPYDNFWTFLSDGIYDSLTSDSDTVTLIFLGRTYTLDASNWLIDYPSNFKPFIITVDIVFTLWAILKMIHYIVIQLQSGGVFNLIEHIYKDDLSDLF